MSFIDWSDPEEMLSLLVEYVEDERSESADDRKRYRFLSWLAEELRALEQRFMSLKEIERVDALRGITASVDEAFEGDSVVTHLAHCADELERIHSGD